MSRFELQNRVKEWKEEIIPINEILDFYSTDCIEVHSLNRPYSWSMSVSSLDGIISWKEVNCIGPEEISLKHIPNSGSGSDWRLLNGGWMFADAILGTGEILRSEPTMKWSIHFPDLVDCRKNFLKKKTKYPLSVILTGSGKISISHPAFTDPEVQCLIITTTSGLNYFEEKNQVVVGRDGTISSENHCISNIVVEVMNSIEGQPNSISYSDTFSLLKKKYNINFLDVTAGGKTIAALTAEHLIDEFRLTVAGQLCGPVNSQGILRPTVFNLPVNINYTPKNNPLISYDGTIY